MGRNDGPPIGFSQHHLGAEWAPFGSQNFRRDVEVCVQVVDPLASFMDGGTGCPAPALSPWREDSLDSASRKSREGKASRGISCRGSSAWGSEFTPPQVGVSLLPHQTFPFGA